MKYLEYDEVSGNIYDANKMLVINMSGVLGITIEQSTSVDDMIKLKNSGFTAEEVIAIKKANL